MGKAPWLQGSFVQWMPLGPHLVDLPSGCRGRLHRGCQPYNHWVRFLDPRLLPGCAEPHSVSPWLNWVETNEISSGQLTEREAYDTNTGGAAKELRISWHPKIKQISALWDANNKTLSQPQVKKRKGKEEMLLQTWLRVQLDLEAPSDVPIYFPPCWLWSQEGAPLREQGGCRMSGSKSPSRSSEQKISLFPSALTIILNSFKVTGPG